MGEKFIDVHRTFLQLIERKEWIKALTMAEQAAVFDPKKSHYTSFWKSCLLAKLHRPKEALAQLKSAIQKGVW